MNNIGNISNCEITGLPTREELAALYIQPIKPIDWKLRTPSKGRAAKGSRNNRGRFLPPGKARRYMNRYIIKGMRLQARLRGSSLYDFFVSQTPKIPIETA